MARRKKSNNDCGMPLSEDMLGDFTGGLDLTRLKVKCPVEGCGFECNTFGEMNRHMRTVHPERC